MRSWKVLIVTVVLVSCGLSLLQPAAALPNEVPFADAGRDQTVAVGVEVQFLGEGYDSDGWIDLYEWDFDGDGSYETTSTQNGEATWTYQSEGVYQAYLRVTDNDGDNDTDFTKITVVSGNEPPIADPGEDFKVHAKEMAEFHGKGSDPDGKIILYEWDFDGDGRYDWNSDETGEAQHIYTVPDTYYAYFRITDNGAVPRNDTASIKVVVYDENIPPSADAGPDMTVYAKQSIKFEGSGSDLDGKISLYQWDFENDDIVDFESATTATTLHKYDKPGKYTARLRVYDNHKLPSYGEDFAIITVTAENKPPTAEAGFAATVKVGDIVSFNGQGTDEDGTIVTYHWDFDGDGTVDWSSNSDGKTKYIYETDGTFEASLMVEDNAGATANSTRTITVEKVKVDKTTPPLIEFNLGFIIALILGLGIGIGVGVGIAYAYLHASIARKYRKVKEIEGGVPGPVDDLDGGSFRGAQVGEREPPAYRGGDQF